MHKKKTTYLSTQFLFRLSSLIPDLSKKKIEPERVLR